MSYRQAVRATSHACYATIYLAFLAPRYTNSPQGLLQLRPSGDFRLLETWTTERMRER